ncbi:hypothetical protein HDE_11420 [Halotydeus destructor]|nr:hypothetical protein HDE_11420 [Halotydeus destructor]
MYSKSLYLLFVIAILYQELGCIESISILKKKKKIALKAKKVIKLVGLKAKLAAIKAKPLVFKGAALGAGALLGAKAVAAGKAALAKAAAAAAGHMAIKKAFLLGGAGLGLAAKKAILAGGGILASKAALAGGAAIAGKAALVGGGALIAGTHVAGKLAAPVVIPKALVLGKGFLASQVVAGSALKFPLFPAAKAFGALPFKLGGLLPGSPVHVAPLPPMVQPEETIQTDTNFSPPDNNQQVKTETKGFQHPDAQTSDDGFSSSKF